MAKRGAKTIRGISYRPGLSRGLPVGAYVKVADNSGVYYVQIIAVKGQKTRLRRLPTATVGDWVKVAAKKAKPELKGEVLDAVVIRQKKPYRRMDGTWVQFEDNAVVIITPDGNTKGSEIRGPVALEAAQRWPKISNIASIIV